MEGGAHADGDRPHVRLDRESIVDAALAVADRDGFKTMTMRSLGAELGVDPTAVYRHFRSKDDLLAAMTERLFADALTNLEGAWTGNWRDDLGAYLRNGRRIYRSHPGYVEALARHPDDSQSLAVDAELGLAILRRAGLPDEDAVHTYHACVDLIAGSGLFHAIASSLSDPQRRSYLRRAYASLPPETHPNCVELAAQMFPDVDEIYDYAVELMLDAIELRARRARTDQGHAGAAEGVAGPGEEDR
jgi:AcrR family transcriptional regulator